MSRALAPAAAPTEPAERAEPQTQATAPKEDVARSPVKRFRLSVLRAAGWSIGGYVCIQLLRISSSLVLTRLLVPEMFGLMAVATMVQVAVAMLSDLGLRPAAIQSPLGDQRNYLDSAWTLQFLHGLLIWAACLCVGYLISVAQSQDLMAAGSVYNESALPAVIAVSSFSSVIAGLQSTKVITAYRRLELGRLTAIELVAQCAGLGVAVVLAVQTRSVWSFVFATLCSAALTTALSFLWLSGRGNRFRLDRDCVRDLIRFGKWVMLSSTFTVVASNGDRILLAGWVGPATLGLYILSFNLVSMLEGAGSRLFHSVAVPALSQIRRESPEGLAQAYWRLRLPFDVLFVTAAGAIFATGDVLVAVLYDSRYEAAGSMLKILSFSLLFSRFGIFANVYFAMGEPRILTAFNFVRGLSIFLLLPIGYLLFDMDGAVWAVALHGAPSFLLLLFFQVRHRLNNLKLELLVLLAWPLGYVAGLSAEWMLSPVVSCPNWPIGDSVVA
ncbi:oligosaccharide flippase family protein [Pseudorhizobium halotolerans]|nr:oligosaccharide flippase family protein [Pseudorhizobium halotolerans]